MASQNKVMVTDYNFATGEVVDREATAEEIASWADAFAKAEAIRAAQA